MGLREDILADPACAAALAARDLNELARIMSIGHTCGNMREIGNNTLGN
jgi:bacterioferritin-associated ferredoxin